jgi:hypothetical protein
MRTNRTRTAMLIKAMNTNRRKICSLSCLVGRDDVNECRSGTTIDGIVDELTLFIGIGITNVLRSLNSRRDVVFDENMTVTLTMFVACNGSIRLDVVAVR